MNTLVTDVTMVAFVSRITYITLDILITMLIDLPVVIFATMVPKVTKYLFVSLFVETCQTFPIMFFKLEALIFYAYFNTLRTGLLNCLNSHSRGLIQSEVRFL